MKNLSDYADKFSLIAAQTLYPRLCTEAREFVRRKAERHRLTQQELRQVCEIARDLEMWRGAGIEAVWPRDDSANPAKPQKKDLLRSLNETWNRFKQEANRYAGAPGGAAAKPSASVVLRPKGKLGLGYCPVASHKTRCCNLLTLDAVDNCGYECSYCSIQSFYAGNRVVFDPDFPRKLADLEIDPDHTYHIGTGQSSDSLMWGNSHGVLDAQLDFAARHPNVILEFKTKSANVAHLLSRKLPPNLLCTWSLNTPAVVDNEERGSAPLDKRLDAAERMAEKGALVGFHFHPMVHYDRWREDYAQVFEQLQRRFDPRRVALVSLGTLTFIKPVMKLIREKGASSQILKMPLVEAEGKLSYPDAVKLQLFRHAYDAFGSDWRRDVFFYLCMEHQRFWKPVFGYDYPDNAGFEKAMKDHYLAKIRRESPPVRDG